MYTNLINEINKIGHVRYANEIKKTNKVDKIMFIDVIIKRKIKDLDYVKKLFEYAYLPFDDIYCICLENFIKNDLYAKHSYIFDIEIYEDLLYDTVDSWYDNTDINEVNLVNYIYKIGLNREQFINYKKCVDYIDYNFIKVNFRKRVSAKDYVNVFILTFYDLYFNGGNRGFRSVINDSKKNIYLQHFLLLLHYDRFSSYQFISALKLFNDDKTEFRNLFFDLINELNAFLNVEINDVSKRIDKIIRMI